MIHVEGSLVVGPLTHKALLLVFCVAYYSSQSLVIKTIFLRQCSLKHCQTVHSFVFFKSLFLYPSKKGSQHKCSCICDLKSFGVRTGKIGHCCMETSCSSVEAMPWIKCSSPETAWLFYSFDVEGLCVPIFQYPVLSSGTTVMPQVLPLAFSQI